MEVTFNNRTASGMSVGQELSNVSAVDTGKESAGKATASRLVSDLTITHATVSPEDVAAAEISEAALTRDDPLGKLIGAAFSLPPPPMPHFET